MNDVSKYTDVRAALVAAGIRTIGFEFDGSGDSGSVNGMVFTLDPTQPLVDGDGLAEAEAHWYAYGKSPLDTAGIPGWTPQTVWSVLEDLADDILANYQYDWYNNDGGAGTAWIDLQTGQWWIDGFTRYTETSSACDEGMMTLPLLGEPDLGALVKQQFSTGAG